MNNKCPCLPLYTLDPALVDSKCIKCDPKCLSCKNDAVTCTECDSSTFFRVLNALNQCECMIGYYNDGADPICKKCNGVCLKCETN